uniref:Uncharacterized protein n=1 Tax=Aegilops tauschii subsp. strangulata TaxID=200361 RepID=A0A453S5Y2_AEGTS
MMVVDSCCNLNSNPEVTTFNLGLYIGLPTVSRIIYATCAKLKEIMHVNIFIIRHILI